MTCEDLCGIDEPDNVNRSTANKLARKFACDILKYSTRAARIGIGKRCPLYSCNTKMLQNAGLPFTYTLQIAQ